MKRFLAVLIILCLMLCTCSVFAEPAESLEEPLSVTLDILNRGADAFYGCDVNISTKDFIALGFELGDACDVVLENALYRYEFKSVPFYNGYYTKTGDPLLCAYGYAIKENRGTIISTREPIIRSFASATTTGRCGTCCILRQT